MKIFTSLSQQKGELGENEAVKYLENRGFRLVERNYTRKWGELDIVAQKDKTLHFIEVKSLTVREGASYERLRPEENMHFWKVKRLRKAIETYIMEREVDEDTEWQFDLICVYLVGNRAVKIEFMEDVVI